MTRMTMAWRSATIFPMYRLMDEVAAMRTDGVPYAEAAAQTKRHRRRGPVDRRRYRRVKPRPRCLSRARPLRGTQACRRRHRRRRPDDCRRSRGYRATLRRPFGIIIEPMLTDQWYVDAATLAKPAIEAARGGRGEWRLRHRAEVMGKDLLQLDGKYPAMVRVSAAVVEPPDTSMVRTPTEKSTSAIRLYIVTHELSILLGRNYWITGVGLLPPSINRSRPAR